MSFKFAREIVSELKKVVWPTWAEARNLTTIVIVVSVAVGAFLGTVDYIFYWIINELILKPR
jgi:preprotein translocase SecE subunit